MEVRGQPVKGNRNDVFHTFVIIVVSSVAVCGPEGCLKPLTAGSMSVMTPSGREILLSAKDRPPLNTSALRPPFDLSFT